MTKNRTLASLISNDTSKIKTVYTDSDSVVTSASLGVTAAAGTATYSSADTLPASADNGDQALVTSTNRLYIHSNGGWYNIALINSTPYWITEADGSYTLSTTGGATIIEILAGDSDGTIPSYTATTDSDFNQIATITQDSDSRWIVTPTDSENGAAVSGSGTVTFKATDGVNLVSTLSTFSLTFISIIENSNYTTLLVKADTTSTDNQVDASTNTHTITEVGNVTSTALSPYHPGGYSTYFDGTGDYLGIPDDNGFELDGDFTIESWFYRTSVVAGTYSSIIGGNGNTSNGWNIYITNSNGAISFFHGSFLLTYAEGVQNDTWYHVAVTRSGTDLKLFVNGAERHAITNSSTFNQNDGNLGTRIGYDISANGYFNGYIRDVRVVKGTAVYTSAFTPPTEPLTAITNTKLLTCHLPYISDGSSNNHTVTAVGNTTTQRFGPYDYLGYAKADHGGSVYFDGSGDYLTVGSASDGGLSGTFTIEFWMYLTTAYTAATQTIVSTYDGSATNWSIQQRNGGQMWLTSSIGTPLSYTLNPASNTWYHIAFSNNSSSSTGKLFVNGVEVDDHTDDLYNSSHMAASAQPITIGRLGNNTSQDFAGYIADLRIIDGTMLYTSDFTPPAAPLTAITNTQLLTCKNKNDIWEQGSGSLLTKVGNTTANNTQRKFTTSSAIYFDGTGDYLSGNDMGLGGAAAFTVEAWMYPTVYNTYANDIYSHGANSSVGADFLAFGLKSDGNVQMFKGSGSPVLLSTSAPCATLNQWYHVAFVRESNNNTSAYVNGVLVAGPTAISGTLTYAPTGRAFIGTQSYNAGASDRSFEGYIQDVRITNGLARYTSNFTPPTAEFEG